MVNELDHIGCEPDSTISQRDFPDLLSDTLLCRRNPLGCPCHEKYCLLSVCRLVWVIPRAFLLPQHGQLRPGVLFAYRMPLRSPVLQPGQHAIDTSVELHVARANMPSA